MVCALGRSTVVPPVAVGHFGGDAMNREQLCQLLGWLQMPKESEMLGRGQHSDLLDRIETIVQQAVLAEREACAKLAEDEYRDFPPFCGVDGGEIVANDIAAKIRKRGEK